MLHVVCAYTNSAGWTSRRTLYRKFERHMLDCGVHLTTVECAYGDNEFELTGGASSNYIQVRAIAPLWHKENLLNIGIERLPDDASYIAWVDADLTFTSPTWVADTLFALDRYDVVQLWTECRDLDAYNQPMATHRAFCDVVRAGEPIVQGPNVPDRIKAHGKFGHPGYAWAAKRTTLEALGGLFDAGILGAGDHHMALAFLGRVHDSVPWDIADGYLRALMAWQRRTRACVRDMGTVPGVIEHGYHGSKQKRAYLARWKTLTDHGYDPAIHLRRNGDGVIELAETPQLAKDIADYFHSRAEDD